MNLKEQFLSLVKFLGPFHPLWSEEIMVQYPHYEELYPTSWLEELLSLSPEDRYVLDGNKDYSLLAQHSHGLREFMEQVESLIFVPNISVPAHHSVPTMAYYRIKEKKRHEINQIGNFLQVIKDRVGIQSILDIGGGVGHLSHALAYFLKCPIYSLDKNADFQKSGLELRKKFLALGNPHSPHHQVHYIQGNLDKAQINLPRELQTCLQKPALTVGLHTCGPFSVRHLELTSQLDIPFLLNFGCCYYHLWATQDFNLSLLAREQGLFNLTQESLTLGTRAHGKTDPEDVKFKFQVKMFRYTFHIFLYEKLQIQGLTSLGNSPKSLYTGEFSAYAKEQLRRIKHLPEFLEFKTKGWDENRWSERELNQFYHDPRIQNHVEKMILCGIIRSAFGRPLELYLLLDRCFFMEEKGHEVSLYQFFSEAISPRNIGLWSQKK